MGKNKRKSHSEVRHLRGQIKKLESELRYKHSVKEFTEEPEVLLDICDHCGKGTIRYFDFVYAELFKCDTCDWQKKQKK